MSKGSRKRPLSIPQEEFDKRWEDIFGKYRPQHGTNKISEGTTKIGEGTNKIDEGWTIVYEDEETEEKPSSNGSGGKGMTFFWNCRREIEEKLGIEVESIQQDGSAHTDIRREADRIVREVAKDWGAKIPGIMPVRLYVGYGEKEPQYSPGISIDPFPAYR